MGKLALAHARSSRQGCGSYGVRVPMPSVSRFGRLAYSMHVFGNSTCSARTKTPRLPCRLRTAAVGAIGVASKLGGLNISEWLQLRKQARSRNRLSESCGKADPVGMRGRPMSLREETGMCTSTTRRGRGPGIQGKICRDNVGKGHLPAGTGDNLRRLADQGSDRRRREGFGPAHGSV